jgi:hypothetical protein
MNGFKKRFTKIYYWEIKKEFPDGSELEPRWEKFEAEVFSEDLPTESEFELTASALSLLKAKTFRAEPNHYTRPNKLFLWRSRSAQYPVAEFGLEGWVDRDGVEAVVLG